VDCKSIIIDTIYLHIPPHGKEETKAKRVSDFLPMKVTLHAREAKKKGY